MPELPSPVLDILLRIAALVACVCGMCWLALSMEAHWQQVRGGDAPGSTAVRLLRALGSMALSAALLLCLWLDHASMAVLVWVMALAAAALIVALTLAWRPHWLSPWAGCLGARNNRSAVQRRPTRT